MKTIFLGLMAAALVTSGQAFGQSGNQTQTQDAKKAEAPADKKPSRKKKAMMCSECGKPESECECHGHKDGEKEKKEEGHQH